MSFTPNGRPSVQITGRVGARRARQLDALARSNNIRRTELVSQMIEHTLAELESDGTFDEAPAVPAAAE